MDQTTLILTLGEEKAVDIIRKPDGNLKVITNYDLELYRLGYISNPYII